MDEKIRKELRDHAWSYFALHADQRLKTFHFYLILVTVIFGAAVTIANNEKGFRLIGLLALLLSFLSFVFWKLDKRNIQLIENGEEAIILTEDESGLPDEMGVPHRLKLFRREKYETDKLCEVHEKNAWRKFMSYIWPWTVHFPYAKCFDRVFFIIGVGGFIGGLVLLFL
jgi:hypothetical protein